MPNEIFSKQLEALVLEFAKLTKKCVYSDYSDIPEYECRELMTRCVASIRRVSGENSEYYRQAKAIEDSMNHKPGKLCEVVAVVNSLRKDIDDGFLDSLEELIHGELFADFLEMAGHLCDQGYKDAAAVIAGSTLESHLRRLCIKHSIPIEVAGVPKKANTMNADLAAAGLYSKLDVKNVIAWLDLRNNAAHGKYGEYDKNQVSLLISSVRDFVTRVPA